MNEAIQREADFAYLASLIDSRSSTVCIRGERILVLKLRPEADRFDAVVETIKGLGFGIAKEVTNPIEGVRLVGLEVCKLLVGAHPHLRSPRAIAHAKLAFRFWKTIQKSGVRLTSSEKTERATIKRELRELHARKVS